MAEIRFEHVRKTFGKTRAVDDVDLDVRDGEFIVLLGPSGCGKTTLLRCLAGLEKVDAGRVHIGDRDATDLPPRRRRIAMVFQSYAVFPHMKVYDNIAFGLKMQKEKRAAIKERVDSAARLMHIEDFLDRYPSQLSGGQRQRVAVARAMATTSDVLLMDEPLSNLDALLRMEMRAELKALLLKLDTTTIYVTHDQIEALSMGDRIAVMNQGHIVQCDTPLAVYDNPADMFVGGFIGTPPMNFLEADVDQNGGSPLVRLSGGSFPIFRGDAGTLAGRKLVLGIRAESIEVETQPSERTVRASVVVVEPLGSHNLLTVRCGNDLLKVSARPTVFPEPDSDIWLRIEPERIRWMDRETREAIPLTAPSAEPVPEEAPRVSSRGALAARALDVLRRNDAGQFFRPGPKLYPFQWNWDSAFAALGLARVDAERGRREVRSLLRGRWADGLVPHIVFHEPAPDYAPGPEVWGSSGCRDAPALPTSGLTQPPVLATAVRALHEAAPDRAFLEQVVPPLGAWHRWLHRERVLDGSGLVAVLHPWEAADNSPRFDAALAGVDAGGGEVARTDRLHAGAEERPTDADYRRYLAIVERLRRSEYRPALEDAPFIYVDLCLNSVLAVAEEDLAFLLDELGEDGGSARAAASRLREALAALWLDEHAVYGEEPSGTFDDLMPLYAGVPDEARARRLFREALWAPERFGPSSELPWAVTTVSKSDSAFEQRRYWRGPVWINVNWFLVRGLERAGLAAEAEELRVHTLRLVEASGFSEYYDPATGRALGSDAFTWSAALTLDLLR